MGLSLSIASFLATHTQCISHKEHYRIAQNYFRVFSIGSITCQNLLIHAETRILPSWSLQTETAMPCSELQRKSQFKSRGVVRMRVILEMSLKKGARISRLIPNKWKVCFHTKSCKFVTDSLDNLASDVYLTSPTFSYLLELL